MTDIRDLFARFSAADASGPEPWADPYPFYRQAREEDPVHFSERFGAWFLTRYSDVEQALQHPSLSSKRADTKFAALPHELQEASVDFKASLSLSLSGCCSRIRQSTRVFER